MAEFRNRDRDCDKCDDQRIIEYKNKAELEVMCEGQKHKVISNLAETRKAEVEIHKSVDKRCVFENEIVEYTVTVKNKSGFKLCGALFIDKLPRGLKYVENSFKVNGCHKHASVVCDEIIFDLGGLDCGEITICFSARVM